MMLIELSPYFHKIYKCPPISAKFMNFHPIFVQLTFFCLIYASFANPCFDCDAFMHHALHVLDTPVNDTRPYALKHKPASKHYSSLPPSVHLADPHWNHTYSIDGPPTCINPFTEWFFKKPSSKPGLNESLPVS